MIIKPLSVACLILAFSGPIFGQTPPEASPASTSAPTTAIAAASRPPKEETTALDLVIREVTKALKEYQDNLGGGANALPPLDSAEFDFKVTTAEGYGGSINFLILKFGASTENSTVNDVAYTYAVPKPPAVRAGVAKKPPPSLPETLVKIIQDAAAAVKKSGTLEKLKFNKLVVTIQYGLKWDVNGGITGTYSFVTVGLNVDKNKNTVQSVKLTFQAPEKAKER